MKRLTYKNGRGSWTALLDGSERTGDLIDRLAAYEESGLDPEDVMKYREIKISDDEKAGHIPPLYRIVHLIEADADGRLIELPVIEDENTPLVYNGRRYLPDHWNILLTAFSDDEERRIHLFDVKSAESALAEAALFEKAGEK